MPMAAAHRTADRADVDDGLVRVRRPVAAHRRVAARGEDARGVVAGGAGSRASNASIPSVAQQPDDFGRETVGRPGEVAPVEIVPRRRQTGRGRRRRALLSAAADCRRRRRRSPGSSPSGCRIASRNSHHLPHAFATCVRELDAVAVGEQQEMQICRRRCIGGSRSTARSARRPGRPARRFRPRACGRRPRATGRRRGTRERASTT